MYVYIHNQEDHIHQVIYPSNYVNLRKLARGL